MVTPPCRHHFAYFVLNAHTVFNDFSASDDFSKLIIFLVFILPNHFLIFYKQVLISPFLINLVSQYLEQREALY